MLKVISHSTNSPLVAASLAALMYGVFLWHALQKVHFDVTSFIVAGSQYTNPKKIDQPLTVLADSAGYDGQFYYRLARAPLNHEPEKFGIRLDSPVYRHQRIIYPLLAYVVALGDPTLIPYTLIAINGIGITVLAFIAGSMIRHLGRHALWALPMAGYAGFLFTLSRDLTEIIEGIFLVTTLLAIHHHRWLSTVLAGTLMLLTKETSAVIIVTFIISTLVSGKIKKRPPVWIALIPLGLYALWLGYVFTSWSTWVVSLPPIIGPPFQGIREFINQQSLRGSSAGYLWLIEPLIMAIFGLTVIASLGKSHAPHYQKWAVVIYAIMLVSLTTVVWVEDIAFMRAASEFFLIGWLILIQLPKERLVKRALAISHLGLWFLVAQNILTNRM